MTSEQAETRRREATRAVVKYFVLGFVLVALLSGLVTYAVLDSQARRRDSRAIRVAYCRELEKLKTQNREDLADEQKHYHRNLRLLGLKETPELRRITHERWDKERVRNAPKKCPYEGD